MSTRQRALRTIFVGNGVNRLAGPTSWQEVLCSLATFVGKSDLIMEDIEVKPFTLVFEEVYFRAARTHGTKELHLKQEAARLVSQIPSSSFHAELVQAAGPHILTTNYDYNLERALTAKHFDTSSQAEKTYSLYRRQSAGDHSVWHIHGETSVPRSLALGHNHYSGSLHHMRRYLVTKSKRSRRKASPFLRGRFDFDKGSQPFSWLDVFLRDDVHIYGFSLDYTEIDIWWLISFKERLRLDGISVGRTYFHHSVPRDNPKRVLAKTAILRSFGVTTHKLDGLDHHTRFNQFLAYFRSH